MLFTAFALQDPINWGEQPPFWTNPYQLRMRSLMLQPIAKALADSPAVSFPVWGSIFVGSYASAGDCSCGGCAALTRFPAVFLTTNETLGPLTY